MIIVTSFVSGGAFASLPNELQRGMIYYEIESSNALKALSMMDEEFKRDNPVLHASALQGFNMDKQALEILDRLEKYKPKLTEREYFQLGKLEYVAERCIPALKAFKNAKKKLNLEERQEWSFYRANCFIQLGSSARAAQVLSGGLLSGSWISHAYYNLAMAYAEKSTNKTKAVVALKVAESLNAGKTKEDKELNDKINVIAGQLYLQDGQPDKAIDVLNKVYLDSTSSALALYLRGVAYLEQGDSRTATQSWSSVKNYHLIEDGVKDSLLAIPFAYERSGYVSQALEAYTEAREQFKRELDTIKKIESLISTHGIRKVFMEDGAIEGVEWFLATTVAANTVRSAYFKHFMRDDQIFKLIELLFELQVLNDSMSYWTEQVEVFDSALTNKNRNFLKQSKSFNSAKVEKKIAAFQQRANSLKNKMKSPSASQGVFNVDSLYSRLNSVKGSIKLGGSKIKAQLKEAKVLSKSIGAAKDELKSFAKSVEDKVADLMLERIKALKLELVFANERTEQGLTHILESIAEANNRKLKQGRLKDGLYQ